jgi:formylglycine-generating enzyme required for sulfatase activity
MWIDCDLSAGESLGLAFRRKVGNARTAGPVSEDDGESSPFVLILAALVITRPLAPKLTPAAPAGAQQWMWLRHRGSHAEVAAPVSTALPPRVLPAMEVGSTFRYFTGGTLIAVPGGPFTMGGSGQDNPTHTVTVDEFWIEQTEVTNRMYALCVAQELCTPPDRNDNPIFTDVRTQQACGGVTWAG